MADLPSLQRWFQAYIVDPHEDTAAVDLHVRPSPRLSALEAVRIYRSMYLLRVENAVRASHPGLFRFFGEAKFRDLVAQYADAHPSHFWNMNRVPDAFPDFLESIGPDFAVDLARLERAIILAMEAPNAPLLRHDDVSRQRHRLAELRVRAVPSLRLLSLRYPVHEYLNGQEAGPERPGHILVYRRQHDIFRQPLNAAEHALLAALVAGATLGEALQQSQHADPAMLFFNWVSAGLFSTWG